LKLRDREKNGNTANANTRNQIEMLPVPFAMIEKKVGPLLGAEK
jgi:hypothetical protein